MEKLESGQELPELNPIKKTVKGTIYLITNIALIVAVVFIYFVSLKPAIKIDWGAITYEIVILCVFAYILFCNSLARAKLKGQNTEAYIKAVDKYSEVSGRLLQNNNIDYLYKFCEEHMREDLENRRKGLLVSAAISYKKYVEEYCNLSRKDLMALDRVSTVDGKERIVKLFTRRQVRAIMQANRMRCKKFDQSMLITVGKVSGNRFLPRDPRKNETFYKVKKIAMSLVTMTLTASITVDAVLDLSWATVAECAVKLVAMAWAWTSGHMFGWDNTTKDEVYFLRSKAEWCDRADRWLNNYLPKAEEKGDN